MFSFRLALALVLIWLPDFASGQSNPRDAVRFMRQRLGCGYALKLAGTATMLDLYIFSPATIVSIDPLLRKTLESVLDDERSFFFDAVQRDASKHWEERFHPRRTEMLETMNPIWTRNAVDFVTASAWNGIQKAAVFRALGEIIADRNLLEPKRANSHLGYSYLSLDDLFYRGLTKRRFPPMSMGLIRVDPHAASWDSMPKPVFPSYYEPSDSGGPWQMAMYRCSGGHFVFHGTRHRLVILNEEDPSAALVFAGLIPQSEQQELAVRKLNDRALDSYYRAWRHEPLEARGLRLKSP